LCLLPSGRRLVYRDAKLETDEYGRDRLTYMGMNQYTRKWERLDTWGGKLVENITQAVARDLMIDATLRVDRETDNRIVLTVHDELIMETASETPKAELKRVQDIMRTNPAWAEGLPTDCDGWTGKRYKK
jgi:DNA polymerase bacteriophage-type